MTTLKSAVESAMHLTDVLLIGTNALIVMATIALSYYTAKVAHETEQQIKKEDSRIIRMLIRRNKGAKHARREDQ